MPSTPPPFVFLDPAGRRWPRLRRLGLGGAALLFLAAVLFVRALLVTPRLSLPASVRELKARLRTAEAPAPDPTAAPPLWQRFARPPGNGPHPAPLPGRPTSHVRLAFTVDWDPRSREAFAAHAARFTHVCPEWFTLAAADRPLEAAPDPVVQETARRAGVVLMPLLRNLAGDAWQPEAVEALAVGPADRREAFGRHLTAALEEAGAGGVAIDWGQVDPAYRDPLTGLVGELAAALHARGLEIWLCIPMGAELRAFDLESLASRVDRFVAMLHDENGEDDAPGPLASQEWFEGWLGTVTAYGRADQWVAALGAYGYDWAAGEPRAEAIGFADALSRAGRAGLSHGPAAPPGGNPHFEYREGGTRHTVWFLDAATFLNQLRTARRQGVGGFALARLGTEDPGVWAAMSLADRPTLTLADLSSLEAIPAGDGATHVGRGEFLTVEPDRVDGRRRAALDASGRVQLDYTALPLYLTVCHQGRGAPDAVALTFDDGPDPRWTPAILEILRARGVKAAFFMVGSKMEENPGLVRRIVAEGHEVGVHTYTHPNLAAVSPERVQLELNATQRLLEQLTGRSTVLFRPPYKADARPETPEEILPVRAAQDLGYLTVSNAIDARDWTRPGPEGILAAVKAARGEGSIVLLHDAGGDRRQTVAALPRILDWLYARGDRVVPLAELLHLPPDQIMPPAPREQPLLYRLVTGGGFGLLHVAEELLWAFMIVASALVVLRTLAVAALAALTRRREPEAVEPSFTPPVSVLLPAFNEEKVIAHTLAALLASDYPGSLEVVVVDDGSTDGTAALAAAVASADPRLRLVRQPNRGKAAALEAGLAALTHEVVVTLDADTLFAPGTIGRLVGPLADPRVGAVSGHAKVGNPRTFIARCQELEYICGFNLDRRAFHRLNAITVVPGAVCALRRRAVIEAGGICADTLAEDTDLTLNLHRRGWRVAYAPQALAWTEAPESIPALLRQRFRWAFGTLQCLWKHRDLLFQPRRGWLGMFSLPGVWFFQILLVALVPLVDGLLVVSLLAGAGSAVWAYFAVFLVLDLALAVLACRLEGAPLKHAWISLPMRLLYRPLLCWVVWKAVLKAVKGAWVGWGKLERRASATLGPRGGAA